MNYQKESLGFKIAHLVLGVVLVLVSLWSLSLGSWLSNFLLLVGLIQFSFVFGLISANRYTRISVVLGLIALFGPIIVNFSVEALFSSGLLGSDGASFYGINNPGGERPVFYPYEIVAGIENLVVEVLVVLAVVSLCIGLISPLFKKA